MSSQQIRFTVLIGIFLAVTALLVIRLSGGDDGPEQAPDLKKGSDGLVREQIGAVDLPTARVNLQSTDPAIREKAVMSYARAVQAEVMKLPEGKRVVTKEYSEPLVTMAKEEKSESVRATAVTALGTVKAYKEIDTILDLLDDESLVVRTRAYASFKSIYGIYPSAKPSDPPAQRRDAIRELRKFSSGLLKTAEGFYTSGRSKTPVVEKK